MEQDFSVMSTLYWGSVIVATIYGLWSFGPAIAAWVLGIHHKCIDCRSKRACNCLEYRIALADDLQRLHEELTTMIEYYERNGWPGHFYDGIERRLTMFRVQLDSTIDFLRSREATIAAMTCFRTIDGFCTFFHCLDCEPNLQEAARRVKARRDNHPESWPPEAKVSSWDFWE